MSGAGRTTVQDDCIYTQLRGIRIFLCIPRTGGLCSSIVLYMRCTRYSSIQTTAAAQYHSKVKTTTNESQSTKGLTSCASVQCFNTCRRCFSSIQAMSLRTIWMYHTWGMYQYILRSTLYRKDNRKKKEKKRAIYGTAYYYACHVYLAHVYICTYVE